MTVQYSQDGTTWTDYPTGEDVYERSIDDFDSKWNRDQIKALIKNSFKARIEYSNDGGYSWTPFRLSESIDENSARIFTMMQRTYNVRTLSIKQIGQVKVSTQPTSTGSFFKSVNRVSNSPARIQNHYTYVYRHKEGAYAFSDLGPDGYKRNFPDAELICTITQKIVYAMDVPNENIIQYSSAGDVRNKAQMRVRGFVFKFFEPKHVPGIAHWFPVLQDTDPAFNQDNYLVVKCARVYDNEMDEFFEGLGPIAGVMSGKYIVGWRNRFKLGDTWLINKDSKDVLEKRIRAKGGAIEAPSTSLIAAELENKKEEVKFSAGEVDPNYIMGIRTNFQEIVRLGDDKQIIEALVQVVDFRNKCVDEIKELNRAIEEARDKVKDRMAHG